MIGKKLIAAAVGIILLGGSSGPSLCQDAASVFTIYGSMYEADDITIVPLGFDMVITNLNSERDRVDEVPLGERDGAGNYSVVWIGGEWEAVVQVGDEIKVTANLSGESIYGTIYTITAGDIVLNRVRIDVTKQMVGMESKTWGAIKSMYRRD